MNTVLTLILVVAVASSGVNGSWWRRNKNWAVPVASGLLTLAGRDVDGNDKANLAKSLGFEPNSEEFLDLFKIADKDGNGQLDEAELKHLKHLVQGVKKLRKFSLN